MNNDNIRIHNFINENSIIYGVLSFVSTFNEKRLFTDFVKQKFTVNKTLPFRVDSYNCL